MSRRRCCLDGGRRRHSAHWGVRVTRQKRASPRVASPERPLTRVSLRIGEEALTWEVTPPEQAHPILAHLAVLAGGSGTGKSLLLTGLALHASECVIVMHPGDRQGSRAIWSREDVKSVTQGMHVAGTVMELRGRGAERLDLPLDFADQDAQLGSARAELSRLLRGDARPLFIDQPFSDLVLGAQGGNPDDVLSVLRERPRDWGSVTVAVDADLPPVAGLRLLDFVRVWRVVRRGRPGLDEASRADSELQLAGHPVHGGGLLLPDAGDTAAPDGSRAGQPVTAVVSTGGPAAHLAGVRELRDRLG